MNTRTFLANLRKCKGHFCLDTLTGILRTKKEYPVKDEGDCRRLCPIEEVYRTKCKKVAKNHDKAAKAMGIGLKEDLFARIVAAADNPTDSLRTLSGMEHFAYRMRLRMLKAVGLR